jgi:apolipoprotein N-acyltransferase
MVMQSVADAVMVLWGWRRIVVALLAGSASALGFAPFHAFPVLWLTLPVLVWLLDGATAPEGTGLLRRIGPALAIGWWFGFGFFLAGMWWIGVAFVVAGGGFALLGPLAMVILPAVLALFWAIGVACARLVWIDGWPRIVVLAVCLSIAEWLRGHVFTGLPWNVFGYALAPNPLMMQSAAVIGVWGLTFFAFLIFAAPAVLAQGDVRRPMAGFLTAVLAIMVAHIGFGFIRLPADIEVASPAVKLRIVQPATAPRSRWQVENPAATMARYAALSRSGGPLGGPDGPTVLIWPESAFPFILTETPSALIAIADLLPPGTVLITGAARTRPGGTDEQSFRAFNSVHVVDDLGEIRTSYDKVHLVPFGEYVPFRTLLEKLGMTQLVAIPGGFQPGARRRTLDLEVAPPVGPLICYEIIFPGAVVDDRLRPHWLVNLTNDAWYGQTPGPYQHFHQARLRAVEEGLPIVRAANSGISAIIDPYGRVTAKLVLSRSGIVDGLLPKKLRATVYATVGDVLFFALLVMAGLVSVFSTGRWTVSKDADSRAEIELYPSVK